jgi:hypothetical protein
LAILCFDKVLFFADFLNQIGENQTLLSIIVIVIIKIVISREVLVIKMRIGLQKFIKKTLLVRGMSILSTAMTVGTLSRIIVMPCV